MEALTFELIRKKTPYPKERIYEDENLQVQFYDGFKTGWDYFLRDGLSFVGTIYISKEDQSEEEYEAWSRGMGAAQSHAVEVLSNFREDLR